MFSHCISNNTRMNLTKVHYIIFKPDNHAVEVLLSVKRIANTWAWGWCLLEWVVVPGRATSLEQGTQVSMATLRAATTHQTPSRWPSQWRVHKPNTCPIHQCGSGDGDAGEKSSTNIPFGTRNKQHNLTQLKCTTRAIQETLYVTTWCMVPWPALAWF